MARMTNTAIYDVEMPDSRKLIDVVNFNAEDEPAGEEGQNSDEGQNGGMNSMKKFMKMSACQYQQVKHCCLQGEDRPHNHRLCYP